VEKPGPDASLEENFSCGTGSVLGRGPGIALEGGKNVLIGVAMQPAHNGRLKKKLLFLRERGGEIVKGGNKIKKTALTEWAGARRNYL